MKTFPSRPSAVARTKRSTPVFLTLDEVAEALNVSRKTVKRRVDAKELHTHRIGRQIRISQEDFASYLATHRR